MLRATERTEAARRMTNACTVLVVGLAATGLQLTSNNTEELVARGTEQEGTVIGGDRGS